ncbi:MAG TPA: family 10 glycosylhydrolase [Planctomycetota bacterium]|jgi:uncharacterized lipoprotein YddW (UPF0748 family)|nr:family 10 glycosylhydrolase [Planctomycetota bacterium]
MLRLPRPLEIPLFLATLLGTSACGNTPLSASLPAGIPHARPAERAMWVTRFDYKTRDDVTTIVQRCKSAGFNTILFQVRGNATAFYRSSLEPWSEQLGGADPGFDPLETAIAEAHKEGMRLAAWVNVMPAWWGTDPPKDPAQVVNKHPEWLWYDQHGAKQAMSAKFYVSLNPCLPAVRKYLVSVLRDVVARYDVDELHLDYIRFPNEQPPGEPDRSTLDYPRDATTVGLFQADTGKTPTDKAAWNNWRTEQVSNLLRDIRRMMRETKPRVELSAAVGVVPENALGHFQDSETWLAEDLLDVVYPMNYTRDLKAFNDRVVSWKKIAKGHHVVMGVSLEAGDMDIAGEELDSSLRAFNGYSTYAYSSIFDSANTSIASQDEAARAQRQQRRKQIWPILLELARGGSVGS